MKPHNIILLQALTAGLLCSVSNLTFSNENHTNGVKSYKTNYQQNNQIVQVYKFTDNRGKVTYSTVTPHDFVMAEQVSLMEPPSIKHAQESKKINGVLKNAADELSEAREKREAQREEKENKRLERQALINRSKPPVIYQRGNYVAYPYLYGRAKVHHKYKYPEQPVHLPAHVQPPVHHRSSVGGGVHSW
jgi:hypothetical protein